MRFTALFRCLLASGLAIAASAARADGAGDPAPVKSSDGLYFDKSGNPTFNIRDGAVDWYTYIGYRMYGANCLQCHGPDALGSSYAPSLVDSFKTLSTEDVFATIIGGKRAVSSSQDLVMPSFGENKNVMCYLNPIYVYLRARSDGAWGRERPAKHEPKPQSWDTTIDACVG